MDIWYAIPSASMERCAKAFPQWKAQGYKTAVLVNKGNTPPPADFTISTSNYIGYYDSVNQLCKALIDRADIIVTGGDDMFPEKRKTAIQLAGEFVEHFKGTLGVMQPTGDNLHANVDQICGSPWLGKEWIKRAYQGNGPFWPEYKHFYGDEELKNVSEKLGLLWIRRELIQYHEHWSRPGVVKLNYQIHNDSYWDRDQGIFFKRRKEGWPGHELLKEKKDV